VKLLDLVLELNPLNDLLHSGSGISLYLNRLMRLKTGQPLTVCTDPPVFRGIPASGGRFIGLHPEVSFWPRPEQTLFRIPNLDPGWHLWDEAETKKAGRRVTRIGSFYFLP
jgi:hypothetical protein